MICIAYLHFVVFSFRSISAAYVDPSRPRIASASKWTRRGGPVSEHRINPPNFPDVSADVVFAGPEKTPGLAACRGHRPKILSLRPLGLPLP